VHVRGAVRNGATEVEIREVLLQVACYCGMPAGLEGTRVAEGVLKGMKERGERPGEESAGVKGA
jgi:4-carboxymuconolactone decarboxylase